MEDAWDFLFLFQLQKYLRCQNLNEKAKVEMMINKIIGDFNIKVKNSVENLVDDLIYENFTQTPKILKKREVQGDEQHISYIETENDDLHLKIYFPQTRSFEYFNFKENRFEEATIIDSDYFKEVKKEFQSLQRASNKLINIREADGDIKFVIPLNALIDYKGLLIRVSTLTFNKGEGVKWGFNQFGKFVRDSIVSKSHLDLLGE